MLKLKIAKEDQKLIFERIIEPAQVLGVIGLVLAMDHEKTFDEILTKLHLNKEKVETAIGKIGVIYDENKER